MDARLSVARGYQPYQSCRSDGCGSATGLLSYVSRIAERKSIPRWEAVQYSYELDWRPHWVSWDVQRQLVPTWQESRKIRNLKACCGVLTAEHSTYDTFSLSRMQSGEQTLCKVGTEAFSEQSMMQMWLMENVPIRDISKQGISFIQSDQRRKVMHATASAEASSLSVRKPIKSDLHNQWLLVRKQRRPTKLRCFSMRSINKPCQ